MGMRLSELIEKLQAAAEWYGDEDPEVWPSVIQQVVKFPVAPKKTSEKPLTRCSRGCNIILSSGQFPILERERP